MNIKHRLLVFIIALTATLIIFIGMPSCKPVDEIPTITQWMDATCPGECHQANDGYTITIGLHLDQSVTYTVTFVGEDGLAQTHSGHGSCTRKFHNYNDYDRVTTTLHLDGSLTAIEKYLMDWD